MMVRNLPEKQFKSQILQLNSLEISDFVIATYRITATMIIILLIVMFMTGFLTQHEVWICRKKVDQSK